MKLEVVHASNYPEFFYHDSGLPVFPGDPIGIEVEHEHEVELLLSENIYWDPPFDEEDE